jgi:serine/threonine protein kinase
VRKANHLVLFDFSLVGAPVDDIEVGTAVYRDPFLLERKRWDSAGDRWSAAVTLHEMLTGERPHFTGPPLDADSRLVLAAERFEIAREQLVAFFNKALARNVADRFSGAEAMRREWSTCFVERAATPALLYESSEEPESSERPVTPPIDYASIAPLLPIAQLRSPLALATAWNAPGWSRPKTCSPCLPTT